LFPSYACYRNSRCQLPAKSCHGFTHALQRSLFGANAACTDAVTPRAYQKIKYVKRVTKTFDKAIISIHFPHKHLLSKIANPTAKTS
jgi:hypothetical protein